MRVGGAAAVGLIAFVAAWTLMLPGVAFWDTGELQTVGPLMGTAHPTGFPTYVLLGWVASVVLQPFGEPAFRMNILSAICLAVAAAFTVDLVRLLTRSLVVGVAAGIAVALTPIAWAVGTHAEAHSLHLALIAVLLWLLVGWDRAVRTPGDGHRTVAIRFLLAASIVFGLAVGNHSLTLLLGIPVGLYVLAVEPGIWRRWRLVLACIGALALTVVFVYLELPLRAGPFRAPLVYGTPDTWDGFRYIVLAEQFRGSLSDPFGELPRKLGELAARAVAQFGILAPFIPVAFAVTAQRRPRYALLTGSAAAITCFFSASYVNADINRYYLVPALMAWSWLAILVAAVAGGLAGLAGASPTRAAQEAAQEEGPDVAFSTPPAVAPASPVRTTTLVTFIVAIALLVPTIVVLPDRSRVVDTRSQSDARGWAAHIVGVLAPDAVIVSWWSYSTPLWYVQRVEGQRPDVTIIDDRTRLDENLGGLTDVIDAHLGKRPVYVIRADPNEVALLAARYDLQYIDGTDARALTRVIGRKTS